MPRRTFRKKSNKSKRKRTLKKNKKLRRKTLKRGGADSKQSYKIGDEIIFTISGNDIHGIVNDTPRKVGMFGKSTNFYKIKFDNDSDVNNVTERLKGMDGWEKVKHASAIKMTENVLNSLVANSNPEMEASVHEDTSTELRKEVEDVEETVDTVRKSAGFEIFDTEGGMEKLTETSEGFIGKHMRRDKVYHKHQDAVLTKPIHAIQWNKNGIQRFFIISATKDEKNGDLIIKGFRQRFAKINTQPETITLKEDNNDKSLYNKIKEVLKLSESSTVEQ